MVVKKSSVGVWPIKPACTRDRTDRVFGFFWWRKTYLSARYIARREDPATPPLVGGCGVLLGVSTRAALEVRTTFFLEVFLNLEA